MIIRKNKGQSAIEYSTILIIVIGALVASQNYFKRGMQGRWKESVDQLGDQYDPRTTNGSIRHVIQTNTVTALVSVSTPSGLQTMRNDVSRSLETKTGSMAVGAY